MKNSYRPTDVLGHQIGAEILIASLQPGKYSKSHKQWDIIRHLKTAYAHFDRVLDDLFSEKFALSSEIGGVFRFSESPTSNLFLTRFAQGCKRRMGQDQRPDLPMSAELLKHWLWQAERKIWSENEPSEMLRIVATSFYLPDLGLL